MSGTGANNGAVTNARDLKLILLSLKRVRILHYAAEEPVSARTIFERLQVHGNPISARTLKGTLAGMVRLGWLKSQAIPVAVMGGDRAYCLTPKGARVLKSAKEQLNQLVAWLSNSQTRRQWNEAHFRRPGQFERNTSGLAAG
jgi:DNA-binding PadR family transcriptional regulator